MNPLLWKTLYFQEEWTVAEALMSEFENRLLQLQANFDSRFGQNRFPRSSFGLAPPSSRTEVVGVGGFQGCDHLYDRFFYLLEAAQSVPGLVKSPSRFYHIRLAFHAIVEYEIGGPFSRATTFMSASNGAIRLHVNWHYLYKNRDILDKNWRGGAYSTILLDGAPDIGPQIRREIIYCVDLDRNILAAGGRDNLVRLWNMEDLSYQGRLESHKGSVLCLQLDSKRNVLISGSSDSTIKVWDLATRQVQQTLIDHKEGVLGLHFEGEHLVSCSKDTLAFIWRLSNGSDSEDKFSEMNGLEESRSASPPGFQLVHILRGHKGAVNSVHFIGDMVATASADRTVRLWDLETGRIIRTIMPHANAISCVQLTKQFVVTGGLDHNIKILNRETGEEIRTLEGHIGRLRSIKTHNKMIISGSYDRTIRMWDLNTGSKVQKLRTCHDSKYLTPFKTSAHLSYRIFKVHRDQRIMIACCENARMVIWDFTEPQWETRFNGTKAAPVDATFF